MTKELKGELQRLNDKAIWLTSIQSFVSTLSFVLPLHRKYSLSMSCKLLGLNYKNTPIF